MHHKLSSLQTFLIFINFLTVPFQSILDTLQSISFLIEVYSLKISLF